MHAYTFGSRSINRGVNLRCSENGGWGGCSVQVYFRNTERTREFVRAWVVRLLTSAHTVYDQEAFNQVAFHSALNPQILYPNPYSLIPNPSTVNR